MERDVGRRKTSLRRRALLVLAAVGFIAAPGSAAQDLEIVAIVNSSNPVSELSLSDLRRIFRGERKRWKNSGEVIQVLLPRPGSSEMDVVVTKIFQMGSVAEVGQYYMAAIYQQKLTESPPTASAEETVRVVSRSEHTLAIVRRSAVKDTAGIKIIMVDGL